MKVYKYLEIYFTSKMFRKIFQNKRNGQFNITLSKKEIDNLIKAKRGKKPKGVRINEKDIVW